MFEFLIHLSDLETKSCKIEWHVTMHNSYFQMIWPRMHVLDGYLFFSLFQPGVLKLKKTMMVDFEKAAIKCFSQIFKNMKIRQRCFTLTLQLKDLKLTLLILYFCFLHFAKCQSKATPPQGVLVSFFASLEEKSCW